MRKLGFIKAILNSFHDFFKDSGVMLAAAVSFFFILALVPYCLMLVAIFGYFLGERPDFYAFFAQKLTYLFPSVTQQITDGLSHLITYRKIGSVTLVLYAFLSYELLASIEYSMDRIFKVKHSRHFLRSLLLSVVIVSLTMAFIVVSFGATYLVSGAQELKRLLPFLDVGAITRFFLGYFLPLLIIFLTLTSLYIILPNRKVKVLHAMSGAIFSAFFLEIAKHLFTIYVGNLLKLGAVYGPLTAFVIFLVWIYYSSCILLIGAEVVHNMDRGRRR